MEIEWQMCNRIHWKMKMKIDYAHWEVMYLILLHICYKSWFLCLVKNKIFTQDNSDPKKSNSQCPHMMMWKTSGGVSSPVTCEIWCFQEPIYHIIYNNFMNIKKIIPSDLQPNQGHETILMKCDLPCQSLTWRPVTSQA